METRELVALLAIVDASEGINSIAEFRAALRMSKKRDGLFDATMSALKKHGYEEIMGALERAMPYFNTSQRERVLAALLL